MPALLVIILILAILLVIFTLQNSTEITLDIFFWQIADVPLVLVLLSCILIGYLLSVIYFYPRIWKVKREYNKLIKFNSELKEYHDLHHKKQNANQPEEEKETNPEGMKFEDDDANNSFFKDE